MLRKHLTFEQLTAFILLGLTINCAHCWQVKEIPNMSAIVGEDLHWKDPNLYLTDFGTGIIQRLDTTTNQVYACTIENVKEVAFIIPQRDSDTLFVVSLLHRVVEVYWDGISPDCKIVRDFFSVEMDNPLDKDNCILDGKCDAKGRLFTGTGNCKGDFRLLREHVFRYADGHLDIIESNVNISNGMTWNYDRKEYYHIDAGANTIRRFKYDLDTGSVSNREVMFKLNTAEFTSKYPTLIVLDSIVADTDGYLYASVYNGKQILKISPDTWQVVERYEIPCSSVTALAFGGPNMDILYIATISNVFGSEFFAKPCGSVFQLEGLGIKGSKENMCLLK